MASIKIWVLIPLLLSIAAPLHADAALLLHQPYGTFGIFTATGHSAVYLTRVCAASPTELRRCGRGELGVVISRYHRIAGYDWIAIPLIPYLYAVEQPGQVPFWADQENVALMRDSYRRKYLQKLVPDAMNAQLPKGEWTKLVGAAYDRKIFGFMIETSEAADDTFIEHFNSHPNKSHFNLLFRNCADFSKTIINFYYPKSVRRNIIADAGITTPKQVAKSLVRLSERHPDLQLSAFVVPQVPGDLKRSKAVRGVFESLIRSKKYVVPLVAIYPWVVVGGTVAYVTGGRFNPAKYATESCDPNELAKCIEARTVIADNSTPASSGLPLHSYSHAMGETLNESGTDPLLGDSKAAR